MTRYPVEQFGPEEDDGRISENVGELETEVVGHRIIRAEQGAGSLTLTLDNGKAVRLVDTDDCCAFTEVRGFTLHPEAVDHVITGVGTTDGATVWHIYADMGDILKLNVGWSCGNPFYYGYGFNIVVEDVS